jgi:hypothetical protein
MGPVSPKENKSKFESRNMYELKLFWLILCSNSSKSKKKRSFYCFWVTLGITPLERTSQFHHHCMIWLPSPPLSPLVSISYTRRLKNSVCRSGIPDLVFLGPWIRIWIVQGSKRLQILDPQNTVLKILSSQKRGGSRRLPIDLSCLPTQLPIFFLNTERDCLTR